MEDRPYYIQFRKGNEIVEEVIANGDNIIVDRD